MQLSMPVDRARFDYVLRHHRIAIHEQRVSLLQSNIQRLRKLSIVVPAMMLRLPGRGRSGPDMSFEGMFKRWDNPALILPFTMVKGGQVCFEYDF